MGRERSGHTLHPKVYLLKGARRQALRFVVPMDCTSQSLAFTLNSGGTEAGIDGTIDDVVLTTSPADRALQ